MQVLHIAGLYYQSASMATNSIILLVLISISSCLGLCSARDVYIQPSEGEHCPGTCYNINTFGKIADSFSNTSGLVVHISEGTHLLDLQKLVVFTNLTNAVFEGDGTMEQGFHETIWQSTVVIKCTIASTGIAFVYSTNITFRYITITNCGADMSDNLNIYTKQSRLINDSNCLTASLGFFYVDHIVIEHASVQNGSETGLLIITNGGDLVISNSSFAQNGLDGHLDGCNIAVVYTDPLDIAFHQCKPIYKCKAHITNTNLSFAGSNEYCCNKSACASISMVMLQRSYTVAIVLEFVVAYKNRRNATIYIASSVVDVPTYNLTIYNSHISHSDGAGLIVTKSFLNSDILYHDLCDYDQAIVIVNSIFTYNHQSRAVIEIAFEGIKYTPIVRIESTEISHNTPRKHGLFFSSRSIYRIQSHFRVTLLNVTVNNNSNCSALSSDVDQFGVSAIHAVFVTSLVLNNVSITNNNITGLSVFHTAVEVSGTSVFHNNAAIYFGGGLAMYGDSYLMFGNHSMLSFTNNSAMLGGAIYVETSYLLSESVCFFQYNSESKLLQLPAMASFSGNNADIAGSVLFGGDIYNCYLYYYYDDNMVNQSQYFHNIFNYSAQTAEHDDNSVISSKFTDVCFCDNNKIDCSNKSLSIKAYPGEKINISIVTVGQENGVVPGMFSLYTDAHSDQDNYFYFTNPKNCTTIGFTVTNNSYSIVTPEGYQKHLNIIFDTCPLGFTNSNNTNLCVCEEKLKQKHTTCDAAYNTMTQPGDIWIGNISETCVVVYSPCPFDYCNTAQVNFSLADPDLQCAHNRDGTLCGSCKHNFSLALGSNNCIQCHNEFSYLALIIPFAAAGFGLVALLMVLNLTVSIGTINGLIFYASIVKISESTGIFFPNGSIRVYVLSQFIAWLNLDLGIETCFYPGMTAYVKVWLQFVFPLYIWFIIATIIVLCRYSTWLSNNIGGNVVQVLATLILLSFTKLFRTFAPALTWVKLSCESNSTTVWYVDGNVIYFSKKHYILMAAAVLFLLLAIPYTLALLFDAWVEKYLTKIHFFHRQWIKFKPLIDAYHGPYKDNCRFWTGLLLLVRMSFTLVSLYLTNFGTLIFITASTTVLLSLLVTFEGVYQKKYLNILECSFLLNLGLLSALAAVYQDHDYKEELVTIISVSAALATFIGILLFHVLLRAKRSKCFRKYVKRFRCEKNKDSEKLLDGSNKLHSQPTSSDVFLKRESLIECSSINF